MSGPYAILRDVSHRAFIEADQQGAPMGTGHLLVAMLAAGNNVMYHALTARGLGVDCLNDLRAVVRGMADDEPTNALAVGLATATYLQVWAKAESRARERRSEVTLQHLMWAIVHTPTCAAHRALKQLGVDPEHVLTTAGGMQGAGQARRPRATR